MRILLCLLLSLPFSMQAQPATVKQFSVGQIKTEFGEILIWLYDQTPRHKQSFIQLANQGYWDSLTFNRVIKNFVAQGGCPDTDKGFSDSPYLLAPEFVDGIGSSKILWPRAVAPIPTKAFQVHRICWLPSLLMALSTSMVLLAQDVITILKNFRPDVSSTLCSAKKDLPGWITITPSLGRCLKAWT